MRSNHEPENDRSFDPLLNSWTVEATPSPRFKEHVWSRIARSSPRAEPALWEMLIVRLDQIFRRPAVAVSYVAILLMLGVAAGYTQAKQTREQVRSQYQAMYVQSIDPYQMPHNQP
ncbi:MAG: hypothetical protein H7Y43_06810 [Akkermansiaceae bacterium]|nr:hypothetical protein [Verrucomicrobiales bacterium]